MPVVPDVERDTSNTALNIQLPRKKTTSEQIFGIFALCMFPQLKKQEPKDERSLTLD